MFSFEFDIIKQFLEKGCRFAAVAICFWSAAGQAAITVPDIFSDRAVLARHESTPVFGSGTPGEKVSVKFNGQIRKTAVAPDGRWEVRLNLKNSPVGPFELHINDRVITDVIVGELFLASGQSNMAYQLWRADGADAELKLPENHLIRYFKVQNNYSAVPLLAAHGQWVYANSENLPVFSAVSYFFAKKIHDALNVPVGIVNASWGGTPLESWMSKESLAPFDTAVKLGEKRLEQLKNYPEKLQRFLRQTAAWEQEYSRDDIPVKIPSRDVRWTPHSGNISGGGIYWLRNRIFLSEKDAANGFRVYLGRLYAPVKIYIDGTEIASADAKKAWSHVQFDVNIPPGNFLPENMKYCSVIGFRTTVCICRSRSVSVFSTLTAKDGRFTGKRFSQNVPAKCFHPVPYRRGMLRIRPDNGTTFTMR